MLQAALQTATAVVSSAEFVACANYEGSTCSAGGTRGDAHGSVCTKISFHLCRFFVLCVLVGMRSVSKPTLRLFMPFRISAGLHWLCATPDGGRDFGKR